MSLLNVRLTKADEEAVRILKRSRVEISAVVRAALRQEAEKHRPRRPGFASAVLEEIFEAFPEPQGPTRRAYDPHDRHAFADAMRAHLAAKSRRSRRR